MTNFFHWLDKEHNNSLYELMTNQLYTAVLGSIIYMLFDWCYTIYEKNIFTEDTYIRTAFLLVAVSFYLADYYYIKGSKPYRKWHFLFDVVFLVCMLYSVKSLNVDEKEMTSLNTNNFLKVKISYTVFLGLYLLWDIRELVGVWNTKKEQFHYYIEVILWEVISLLLLFFFCKESEIKLLLTLIFTTLWFCLLSFRKSKHQSIKSWINTPFSA